MIVPHLRRSVITRKGAFPKESTRRFSDFVLLEHFFALQGVSLVMTEHLLVMREHFKVRTLHDEWYVFMNT